MKQQILTILAFVLVGFSAQSSVIYVNVSASGNNDGSSWVNAYVSLQDAILASSQNDELWVAQGTYIPDRDISGNPNPTNMNDKAFYFTHDVKVYGGFTGTETMLSERDYENNNTILSAYLGVFSGPVYAYRVIDQTTALGSGFLLDGLTIRDANNSGIGGGIYIDLCIGGKIQNCRFTNNLSGNGGGINASTSELYIWDCAFYDNTGISKGGAIRSNGAYLDIRRCDFNNNSAGYGGAVLIESYPNPTSVIGQHSIANCLFYENTSTQYGGSAFFAYNTSDVSLYNCTMNQNTEPGGGSAGEGTIRSNGVGIKLYNCIVWQDIPLTESSDQPIFTVENSIIKGGTATCIGSAVFLYDLDPMFIDPMNSDYTLPAASPAVDAGDSTGIASFIELTDLNGNDRYVGDLDLGCFEYFCQDTADATITYQENLTTEEQTLSVPATQTSLYEWVDCDNNYATITGPTLGANGYAVSEQGNYACIVTNGCATDTSDCYLVDYILSTPDLNKASLRVFPNPVQTTLYLDHAAEEMHIFTISGAQVFESAQKLTSIDVSALRPGVYFIESQHGSERFTTRFVKE